MNLKNGYKTLYEVVENSNRVFYASKTGSFADAEMVASYPVNSFKVIYQDADHMLYGIDADNAKVYLNDLNRLFAEELEGGAEDMPEEEEEIIPQSIDPVIEPEVETTDEQPEDDIPGEEEEV